MFSSEFLFLFVCVFARIVNYVKNEILCASCTDDNNFFRMSINTVMFCKIKWAFTHVVCCVPSNFKSINFFDQRCQDIIWVMKKNVWFVFPFDVARCTHIEIQVIWHFVSVFAVTTHLFYFARNSLRCNR